MEKSAHWGTTSRAGGYTCNYTYLTVFAYRHLNNVEPSKRLWKKKSLEFHPWNIFRQLIFQNWKHSGSTLTSLLMKRLLENSITVGFYHIVGSIEIVCILIVRDFPFRFLPSTTNTIFLEGCSRPNKNVHSLSIYLIANMSTINELIMVAFHVQNTEFVAANIFRWKFS